jgi:hypothetical protein
MPVSVEIHVEIPELVISSSVIRNAIFNALKTKTGPHMMRLFLPTVTGWETQVKFIQSGHNWLSEIAVRVFTRSKIYAYVNDGTPEHPIFPRRRNGVLRFQPGYRAGTRPGILSSRSPQRFGGTVTSFGIPKHPGIQARDFDVEVAEQVYPDFVADVNDAIGLGINWAK